MKFIWAMEHRFALRKGNFFITAANADAALINVHHFPVIMSLAVENEVFIKFKIVYRYYFGDVYKISFDAAHSTSIYPFIFFVVDKNTSLK